jgi:aldehyde:ferredoxin oxidoreductase
MDLSMADVVAVADRVMTLERAFNLREGFRRRDDTLPARILREPIPDGPARGQRVTETDLSHMIDEYYEARHWDSAGIPRSAHLRALSLGDLDHALEPIRAEAAAAPGVR